MFQQKNKKKPPPRPPPPNFIKYKSKSSFNLAPPSRNLIDWSPPSSPKQEKSTFGGSVSSSYSSSTSSISSSKKSFETDSSSFYSHFTTTPTTPTLNWLSNNPTPKEGGSISQAKPRIIRALPPKRAPVGSPQNCSPPMPQLPPPSPPKEAAQVITPYGIALFNFPATQPGDLPLQVNDVVHLIRRVNKEWLYGQVCDKEGMFPENFIQIEVPLPEETNLVTALYEFTPEISGDLELKPGQKIKIIREVSKDWLYGESEGKYGQFPRNFVS